MVTDLQKFGRKVMYQRCLDICQVWDQDLCKTVIWIFKKFFTLGICAADYTLCQIFNKLCYMVYPEASTTHLALGMIKKNISMATTFV